MYCETCLKKVNPHQATMCKLCPPPPKIFDFKKFDITHAPNFTIVLFITIYTLSTPTLMLIDVQCS